MTGDPNLLRALFVQQLGFAPSTELMVAGAEWLARRDTGVDLCDVLVQRGVLDEAKRALVENLVRAALARAAPPVALGDESLEPTAPSPAMHVEPGEATAEQVIDSLETPENVGAEARGRYSFDTGPEGTGTELGRGGVGQVLLAKDHFLERLVAFKVLNRDITTSPMYDTVHVRQLEARFLREARVTAQLDHPAIVPVYELGRRRDGTLYYTMQRVRGRTLADALDDAGSLEARLTLIPDLLVAAQAVASAHHRKVLHRDLKPQNVMLGTHGETYVLDWGLARVIGRPEKVPSERDILLAPDLTGAHEAGPVGTPSYMSPEQARRENDRIDERSDVWGLGCMLFELLTGRAPFVGPNTWDVLAEVANGQAPKVRSLEPAAPLELVAICERALSKNPDDRHPSAAALAVDLQAWLEGRRVPSAAYSARQLVQRLVTKHRPVLALVAGTLLTLIGISVAATLIVRHQRDEARTMARVLLADLGPVVASSSPASAVFDRLTESSLESFAQGLDLDRGPISDLLVLAHAWNDVAALNLRLNRGAQVQKANASAGAILEALRRRRPNERGVLVEAVRHELLEAAALGNDDALPHLRRALPLAGQLEAAGPSSPDALEVAAAFFRQLSTLELAANEGAAAHRSGAHAVALAERWVQLSAVELAQASLVDSLLTAADAQLLEAPLEGRASLARAVAVARELDRRHGSTQSKLRLAAALAAEGQAEIGVDSAAAATALAAAASLLEPQVGLSSTSSQTLARFVDLETLQLEADQAWRTAQPLVAEREFEPVVLRAAFLAGHDELLARAQPNSTTETEHTRLVYGALAQALAGNRREALVLAVECQKANCFQQVRWLPEVVAARANLVTGPGHDSVLRLVDAVPVIAAPSAQRQAAWRQFVDTLGGGGP